MAFQHRKGGDPLEPTPTEDLVAAREQADAGLRLALPQLFDQSDDPVGSERPAPIDHEVAKEIGGELLDVQGSIARMALALPLEGHIDIHLALNAMGNEVERLLKLVSERWGEQ